MKHTVYVFVNEHGYFYSTSASRPLPPRNDRMLVFNKNFNTAEVFSSAEAANKHRSIIINTRIQKEMHLLPLDVEINERNLFSAVLKGD